MGDYNDCKSFSRTASHQAWLWWAAGFAAAGILLVFAWSILPGGALLGFLCELVGGILALTAIIRNHERSWLVIASILPMLNVLFFIVAEFIFPH